MRIGMNKNEEEKNTAKKKTTTTSERFNTKKQAKSVHQILTEHTAGKKRVMNTTTKLSFESIEFNSAFKRSCMLERKEKQMTLLIRGTFDCFSLVYPAVVFACTGSIFFSLSLYFFSFSRQLGDMRV